MICSCLCLLRRFNLCFSLLSPTVLSPKNSPCRRSMQGKFYTPNFDSITDHHSRFAHYSASLFESDLHKPRQSPTPIPPPWSWTKSDDRVCIQRFHGIIHELCCTSRRIDNDSGSYLNVCISMMENVHRPIHLRCTNILKSGQRAFH
jgi:hypothetical protein